jgi:tetratricopeptide (TPR) repeat protein
VKRIRSRRGVIPQAVCCAVALGVLSLAYAGSPSWGEKSFAADPEAALRLAQLFRPEGDHDAVVLFDETSYSYDNLGRLLYKRRSIYQIRAPQGLENWGGLEEEWAPWRQERPSLRARVVNPDGRVHWLDKKTIDEAPASSDDPSVHDDNIVLRAPLPGLVVGSVVEEEIIVRGSQPFFAAGDARRVYFTHAVPVQFKRLIVETAGGTPLRNVIRLLPDAKKIETGKNGVSRLVVEAGPLRPWEAPPPGLPSDVPRYPYVAFSTGRAWNDVASAYDKLVEGQVKNSGLGELAMRLASAFQGDRTAIIKALTDYVTREVRYTGLEFGRASLVPEKPNRTLARKYGDCKDKSALLATLLREVGVEAHVVLLYAAWGQDVEGSLPGFGLFNHAIVYVPGAPELWIDPTDEFGPWGDLPVACEGRLALVIDPRTSELRKTPESASLDNQISETRVFELSESGPARVTETTVARGEFERSYRSYYASAKPQDLKGEFEEYIGSMYLAKSLESFDYSRTLDDGPFTLKLVAAKASRGISVRNEAVVAIRLEPLVNHMPSDLTSEPDDEAKAPRGETAKPAPEREHDYVIATPHVIEWDYQVNYPPGFRLVSVPPSRTDELGPARISYEFAAEPEGNCVKGKIRFDTVKRRFTPAETDALRSALKKLTEREALLITFDQVGETLLAAGKGREAIAEFRRLAEMHPQEALHHAQLSRSLLSYGLRDAAVREATTATELEPNSAPAWMALAWALEHDSIGRRFADDFDHAGAERAYRKAIEADPEDADAKSLLAVLLEHDTKGQRYSAQSRLAEAIEIYQKLGDKLDGSAMEDNLAFALMWSGRYPELVDLLKRKKRTQTAQAIELVAVAKMEGAAAALAKAYAVSDQQVRLQTLRLAVNMLLQLGAYPEAAELFAAGAQGQPSASQLLAFAGWLRKARPGAEVMKDENSPVNVARQATCWLLDDRLSKDLAPKIFSRHSLKALDIFAPKARQFLRAALSGAGTGGLPARAVVDVGLAALTFRQEGEDEVLRIGISAPGFNDQPAFVTKEADGFRVLATGACVGREVMSRVEEGDMASAKQLLDWAVKDSRMLAADLEEGPRELASLWTEKTDKSKAENLRIAAAALCDKQSAKEGQAILRNALAAATDPADREKLSNALGSLLAVAEDYEGLLALARQMNTEFKASERAQAFLTWSLGRLGRWQELETELLRELQEKPDNTWTMRKLSDVARRQGELKKSWDLLKGLVDQGKAEAMDYNNLAWTSLLLDSVSDSDLEYSQKSVTLEKRSPAALHTLACLYAETDKATAARDVIWEAVQSRETQTPEPSDWYVFGRIADGLGVPEAAIPIYERVIQTEDEEADSVRVLATRRLARLKSD